MLQKLHFLLRSRLHHFFEYPILQTLILVLSVCFICGDGVASDVKSEQQPNPTKQAAATSDNSQEPLFNNFVLTPQISNGPKMGFSAGAIALYLHQFDKDSPPSVFGVSASYSNTDSHVGGVFANTYWDKDTQRFTAGIVFAEANNDYKNFQGGPPLSIEDNLHGIFVRYLHKIEGTNWFIGPNYIYANHNPIGTNSFSETVLDEFNYSEQTNTALGISATFDTRDNVYLPTKGSFTTVFANRFDDLFGGDTNFNSLNINYSNFTSFSEKSVLGINGEWLFTPDAPVSSQATLRRFRGYTTGENSGESVLICQGEYTYSLSERWLVAGFGGVATITDKFSDFGDTKNWYPMVGAGIRYILKPKQKLFLRLDFAQGKNGSNGLYLKIGQAF